MQREFPNLCINSSQLNQAVLGRQILGSNLECLNVYKDPNWNEETGCSRTQMCLILTLSHMCACTRYFSFCMHMHVEKSNMTIAFSVAAYQE